MSASIRLKNNGWVVVADGAKALFLRNAGNENVPKLEVFKKKEQDNPATRDQGTDRPGRLKDGPGSHRSSVSETDWHALAEDRFASELSDILYQRAHKGDFGQIVLVAAPSVLGEIRKNLHKEVSSRVIAEIAKDLTNHAVGDIQTIVFEKS